MLNWSSFYILKLNVRKSLDVSYTYSHPLYPSPPILAVINCLRPKGITKFIRGIRMTHESELHVKPTIVTLQLIYCF